MPRNIDRTEGGGPWILNVPDLDPGDTYEWQLRSMEYRGRKGYFKSWLPLDNATIKNRDENDVLVTFNGQFEVYVEQNAADTYGEAGITSIRIENKGSTVLAGGNIILQVSVEPYDADDAARRERRRSPAAKLARGFLGL